MTEGVQEVRWRLALAARVREEFGWEEFGISLGQAALSRGLKGLVSKISPGRVTMPGPRQ